jgi:hypothetical protein
VIGGYTPDNPLDALIVGYIRGEKLSLLRTMRPSSCSIWRLRNITKDWKMSALKWKSL